LHRIIVRPGALVMEVFLHHGCESSHPLCNLLRSGGRVARTEMAILSSFTYGSITIVNVDRGRNVQERLLSCRL